MGDAKMRSIFLLLLLLLGSCATQRQANTPPEVSPAEKQEAQSQAAAQQHGRAGQSGTYRPRFYPPAIYTLPTLLPVRSQVLPLHTFGQFSKPGHYRPCPQCPAQPLVQTAYLLDTLRLDSLNRELKVERLANVALRDRLQRTEADRDYWREMNRKKRWAIIAMIVFAVLYILFKVLAARVRESEE
ncbi:hypothetical protein C8N40_102508 [Pontibacter mucosus]|uniref:Uncharacterized protein n=1 Tax=Pontibacter mucosus TaxID=1649266 RepID=A0A2T5YQE4_9BACT|nr:hypothetical protein [Pontibacter mucosus]PTX21532.1 hypothetical protein C8N40_102508 [Pontibacter mucosus]